MSNVIVFRAGKSSRAVIERRGERGRILLFTGVRYMREDDEALLAEPRAAAARGTEALAGPTERLQA